MNHIPYNTQYTDEDDIDAIVNLFESKQYLTCGPIVKEFENKLSQYTGAKYCVSVNNGTSALHLACLAIDIKEGDEVIVPAITFAATSNSVLYCNGKPIFCDIDQDTLNIDCTKIESLITHKTKAIICVDMGGQLCDYHSLRKICKKYNLILIEDAAHSIGGKTKSCVRTSYVGSFADLTTFSFHPVKNMTTGEGGAIMTNNENFYNKIVQLRNHGITKNFEKRNLTNTHDYDINMLGYNYRLPDINAALGLSQLKKLDLFMERREDIKNKYIQKLKNHPYIKPLKYKFNSANHLFIVRIKNGKRDEVYNKLKQKNIFCNVHYKPVYLFSYYQTLGYKKGLCPVSEKIYHEILSLPIYYMFDTDIIDTIIQL